MRQEQHTTPSDTKPLQLNGPGPFNSKEQLAACIDHTLLTPLAAGASRIGASASVQVMETFGGGVGQP
jgi:deoxyribose-phosphate aldolase